MDRKFGWYLSALLVCVHARMLTRQAVWERFVINYADPNYSIIQLNMTKPDRKTFSANMSVEVVQDIPLNLKLKAALYKYTDNTFKKTAFVYEGTVCEYYDYVHKSILKVDDEMFKNFFRRCPITKGVYTIYNLNEKVMENPMLPLWRCKAEFEFLLPQKGLFKGTLLFTVIEV